MMKHAHTNNVESPPTIANDSLIYSLLDTDETSTDHQPLNIEQALDSVKNRLDQLETK